MARVGCCTINFTDRTARKSLALFVWHSIQSFRCLKADTFLGAALLGARYGTTRVMRPSLRPVDPSLPCPALQRRLWAAQLPPQGLPVEIDSLGGCLDSPTAEGSLGRCPDFQTAERTIHITDIEGMSHVSFVQKGYAMERWLSF